MDIDTKIQPFRYKFKIAHNVKLKTRNNKKSQRIV